MSEKRDWKAWGKEMEKDRIIENIKKKRRKRKPLPWQKGWHHRKVGLHEEIFKTEPLGKKHRKIVKSRSFRR